MYGILLGAIWRPSLPSQYFGLVGLNAQFDTRAPAIVQGLVLLAAGVYLMPGVVREHIAGAPDRDLAALTERVQTLTQTRTDATDAAGGRADVVEMPVAAAVYFAVAEALANAARRLMASWP